MLHGELLAQAASQHQYYANYPALTLKNLRVMSEANYNKLNGKITSKNSP